MRQHCHLNLVCWFVEGEGVALAGQTLPRSLWVYSVEGVVEEGHQHFYLKVHLRNLVSQQVH